MPLSVTVRAYKDAPITRDEYADGTRIGPYTYKGIGDADAGSDGVSAYIDLDPDPDDPERTFSSLDLTGQKDDFERLVEDLQSFISINWPDTSGTKGTES